MGKMHEPTRYMESLQPAVVCSDQKNLSLGNLTFFDRLPAELLYTIWDHLWGHEILHAFLEINEGLDRRLSKYQSYRLDTKQFDQTSCSRIQRYIKSDKILYLRLTYCSESPSMPDAFLLHRLLSHFKSLRSITLENLSFATILYIFQDLLKLDRIESICFSLPDGLLWEQTHALRKLIYQIQYKFSTTLRALTVDSVDYCDLSIIFNSLRRFKIHRACSNDQFRAVLQNIPFIRNFDVFINAFEKITFSYANLRRLHLRVNDCRLIENLMIFILFV